MAIIRHVKDIPGPDPGVRKRTRSSLRLRTTTRIQPLALVNGRLPNRKDTSSTKSAAIPVSNTAVYRHRIHKVVSAQRSSLRRALRESLESLDDTTHPSVLSSEDLGTSSIPAATAGSDPPRIPQPRFIKWARESGDGNRDIYARSGNGTRAGAIVARLPRATRYPNPQCSSLRRAIRESLGAVDSSHRHPTPFANYPKPHLPTVPALGQMPNEKPRAETRIMDANNNDKGEYARLPSKPKADAVSSTKPQRSSLRRALRESLRETGQNHAHANLELDEIGTSSCILLRGVINDSRVSSDSELDLSSGASPDAPLTPQRGGDDLETSSKFTGTFSISSSKSYLSPVITAESASLQPRRWLTPKASLTTEPLVPKSSPSVSKLASNITSSLGLCDPLNSPPVVSQHQIPALLSLDEMIVNNSWRGLSDPWLVTTRAGWYEVDEIVNEAPSGLYLVEWKGHDPRTGVKWPASWVKANNVSTRAIHEWEERKLQFCSSDEDIL